MDKEWIPIIGNLITVFATLLGVGLGSAVTIWIKRNEFQHQINQENRKQRLSKLEQLHEETCAFTSILLNQIISVIQLTNRTFPNASTTHYPENYFLLIDHTQKCLSKIEVLTQIYAPEFTKEIENINSELKILNNSIVEHIKSKENNDLFDRENKSILAVAVLQRRIETKIKTEFLDTQLIKNS